jgi:hypothetical protein
MISSIPLSRLPSGVDTAFMELTEFSNACFYPEKDFTMLPYGKEAAEH